MTPGSANTLYIPLPTPNASKQFFFLFFMTRVQIMQVCVEEFLIRVRAQSPKFDGIK
jgi:hypothetical protein